MKNNHLLLAIIGIAAFLRFAFLAQYPPALFVDEAAIGYNAWSLSLDLKDEFGTFMPLAFRSWGTYTAPLQFYLAIPGVMLFGLNEFGTRFHAALLGTLTVLITYLLVYSWFGIKKRALLSSLFLAISPWHIHQSRMAVEPIISVFFFCLGTYFLIRWRNHLRTLDLTIAIVAFVLTAYAYHSARLTSPLFLLLFCLLYIRILIKHRASVFVASGIGFVVAMPLLYYVVFHHMEAFARPRAISVFAEPGVTLQLWEWTTTDQGQHPVTTRMFHNKLVAFTEDIIRRYVSHFDPDFLFITGDPHERFHIPSTGILLAVGAILIPVGLWNLFHNTIHIRDRILLFGWIVIAPLVSSLAVITPNSYHMLEAVIPWMIVLALGVLGITRFSLGVLERSARLIICGAFCAAFLFYLGQYYVTIPYKFAHFWGYGYKDAIVSIQNTYQTYDTVISSGRHYIYFLYWLQINPQGFRKMFVRESGVDAMGFENIAQFERFRFPANFHWETLPKQPGILYIAEGDAIPDYWTDEPERSGVKRASRVRILHRVLFPNGKIAMKVADVLK